MPSKLTTRKAVGLLVLAATAAALLVLSGVFSVPQRLSGYCVSPAQWQALQQARTATAAPLLQTLSLNDHALLLDEEDGCFYYSLIQGDPDALDPPLAYRGGAGVSGGAKVQLAIREGAITAESLAAGEELQLLAYTDTEYRLYRLACTTLPLINISGAEPEQLISEDRTPREMQFWLFDNRPDVTQRVVQSDGSIHVRGITTASYPKKGFRLTLRTESPGNSLRENPTALLGLRADGDWLLYAAYNDQEKVRNVFSSNLWYTSCAQANRFGVAAGMEYRYVELFLNGRYWGLYALGYPIDAAQLHLRAAPAPDAEPLFQKDLWVNSETEIVAGQPFLYGYILETLPDEDPDTWLPEELAAWRPLVDYYLTLATAQDPAALYAAADFPNAIDIWLFFNLVQGSDNVASGSLKNLYIAFKRASDGMVALYVPWDLDLTWGNLYAFNALSTGPYAAVASDDFVMDVSPVARLQQLGDADINDLIKARYAALRADAWSETALLHTLDGLEADIFASGAFARDAARWPDGNYVPADQKLSVFKDYVRQRLAYMDAFVAALD